MKPEEVVILRETHDATIRIEEKHKQYEKRMEGLEETIYGNGKSGLKIDVALMKKWFYAVWIVVGAISMAVFDLVYERIANCSVNH